MANKFHRAANGQQVDMQQIILKNEEVRAVGNMKVNARGDVLDSNNVQVVTRNQQVNKQYRKQSNKMVTDQPVVNSKKAAQMQAEKFVQQQPLAEKAETVIAGLDDEETSVESKPAKTEKQAVGGLASAIAKAREVKQEPAKTQREIERSQTGVKKI